MARRQGAKRGKSDVGRGNKPSGKVDHVLAQRQEKEEQIRRLGDSFDARSSAFPTLHPIFTHSITTTHSPPIQVSRKDPLLPRSVSSSAVSSVARPASCCSSCRAALGTDNRHRAITIAKKHKRKDFTVRKLSPKYFNEHQFLLKRSQVRLSSRAPPCSGDPPPPRRAAAATPSLPAFPLPRALRSLPTSPRGKKKRREILNLGVPCKNAAHRRGYYLQIFFV
jgi:hypothetical protein